MDCTTAAAAVAAAEWAGHHADSDTMVDLVYCMHDWPVRSHLVMMRHDV